MGKEVCVGEGHTCIKHMKLHILHGLGTSLSAPKDIQLVSNGCR